jgi:hypothetical protein
MYLLQILQQAQARQRGEAAYAYIHSEEGKAMMAELDRLRAECAKAEANYLATCARCDAERAAAEAKEFGDYRSDAEMASHYGKANA